MTHPTLTPRGTDPAMLQPAPIELQPRGGCEGVRGRVLPHLVGECLLCPRLGVSGPQIRPRYVRQSLGIKCEDVLHGGVTVLPLPADGEAVEQGGVGIASIPMGDESCR